MISAITLGILGLSLAVILWAISTFNRLIRQRNMEAEAWSLIDVQLRRRHDLVPALVEVVKGYSSHEKSVLTEVTRARSRAVGDPNRTDEAEHALTSGLRHLFAIVERYPELRADENFRKLSQQLVEIEDALQYARRYYNGVVRDFRNLTQSFPTLLIARLFGFQPGKFFEVESSVERENPSVRL